MVGRSAAILGGGTIQHSGKKPTYLLAEPLEILSIQAVADPRTVDCALDEPGFLERL